MQGAPEADVCDGFYSRPGKGSHVVFYQEADPSLRVTLSGRDGDDADAYQIYQVKSALKRIKGGNNGRDSLFDDNSVG